MGQVEKHLDPAVVMKTIMDNRENFISYNIARIRELIRYLPKRRFKLFNTIPFLLHINSPEFPGYVDHPLATYGIYAFHDSGFWKLSLTNQNLTEKQMRPYLARKYHIRGLYLMGSAGTLAQGRHSDLDYWVVVDKKACTETQLRQLREKLSRIEKWCRGTYGQELTFFIMDREQIRENDYSAVDDESSGSAQKTILKEEFYRTLIVIAGQIPFWAVLPPGLSNGDYDRWIRVAHEADTDGFIGENIIDLGNITAVDRSECLGAILWQVFKARHDPVKSLLKASLIAHYSFFNEELPCDLLKGRLKAHKGDPTRVDPYVVIFEKILNFYKVFNEERLSEAVKECIFLRLRGYPLLSEPAPGTPKRKILKLYLDDWAWSPEQLKRFETFPRWPEEEKKEYEQGLFDRISYLYEMILRSREDKGQGIHMDGRDLALLKNQISRCFQKKPGKIPFCSSYLKSSRADHAFLVECAVCDSGQPGWTVYDHTFTKKRTPLFSGPELLRVVGWMVKNNLYRGNDADLMIRGNQCGMNPKFPRRLFGSAHRFFTGELGQDALSSPEPHWTRILVSLNTERTPDGLRFTAAEYIIENSWQEFYFDGIDLSHIENRNIKCYKICDIIWNFQKKAPPGGFDYKICHLGVETDPAVDTMIRNNLKELKKKALETQQGEEPTEDFIDLTDEEEDDPSPLLDLL